MEFYEIGKKKKNIEVTISYRIIQLFSEGLYSSPHKAIEELVSNAFDADARNVNVILPSDFYSEDATITIIDDGEGMNFTDLSNHWVIGKSVKLKRLSRKKRSQIGKFGIGKLATYVLSNRFTHICKKGGKYYSTSMDYETIPQSDGSIFSKKAKQEKVKLPFRELTEKEAKEAIAKWTKGSKAGYKALKLFGKTSRPSWTVAIMSELKHDMMANLKVGMLKWVLSTALPHRDDFKLFLNGDKIESSRKGKPHQQWILGKNLLAENLEEPTPDNITNSKDNRANEKFGLHDADLGRITGYVELYDNPLDTGKDNGRSNGFFIYVRDRLINEEDGHFGIGSNELSHGPFSRMRAIIKIDKLDDDLRSSRENVRQSITVEKTKNLLRGIFNFIRREYNKREKEKSPAAKFSSAVAASPYTLTHRPILNVIKQALDGKFIPRYLQYSEGLTGEQKKKYIENFEQQIAANQSFIKSVDIAPLNPEDPIAILNIDTGLLKINSFHPFVGHFLNEYENTKSNLPLELLAMSEVILEASLLQTGIGEEDAKSIMSQRDELLRTLAKSTTKKNALLVAQALLDSANNQDELETQVVAAFSSMGFESVKKSGKNNPDGIATAALGVSPEGSIQRYKISLEAKSKEKENRKVGNNTVRISTVARHRKDNDCDHAIVVGPDFPKKGTALDTEIQNDLTQTGKTITVMTISDLARLVRLRPLKRIGPAEIRDLFKCRMPEDCKKWVDELENRVINVPNYKAILQIIWERQNARPDESIEYGVIAFGLEQKGIKYRKDEIKRICKSLEGMVPGYLICRENDTVELRQNPSMILEIIKTETEKYPDSETKFSFLN